MKILPQTPSVDFLRKEAKDLLRAMRESEPDTTLTQAQRALAQRYGFSSWTELKDEVERRRATDAAQSLELGAALASAFGLGSVSEPMQHVAWAQTGERWSLQTESGSFTCRTVLPWISEGSAEGSFVLRMAARECGVRAPEPVRTVDGGLIADIGGKRWCVDRGLETGRVPTLPVSSTVGAYVGATLATLHAIEICLGFPESAEVEAWGRPTFRAGQKIFAVFGGPDEKTASSYCLIFKPDPGERPALVQDDRFFSPRYWGPGGWLGLDFDAAKVEWDEVWELCDASYRQVALKRMIKALDAGSRPTLGGT